MALFLTLVNLFLGGQFRKCPLGVELGITVSQDVPVLLTVFTKVKTVTSHIDCMHQLSTVQMVHPATKKSYSPFYIPGENFPIEFGEIAYKYFALVHLFDSCFSFDVTTIAVFTMAVQALVDTLIIGTLDNIHPSFLCLVQVYQRVGFIG
jgi:hypothetical protein